MRRGLLGATLLLAIWALVSGAQATDIKVCFTPGEDCTGFIVGAIEAAKERVLVQAYGFTSAPIIRALAQAKDQGVDVEVILDRSNERRRYTGAAYLLNHGIQPLIDDRVAIAHNKVMVIDGKNVITGSFNFTKAAQYRNAENVLLILDDAPLAQAYTANWNRRREVSHAYQDFRGN